MRVLMWMTGAGGDVPGGHRVQMERTAAALRELGVDARTTIADELPDEAGDLVHGFGLSLAQIAEARRRGLPVALSPIYIHRRYYRVITRSRSLASFAWVAGREAARAVAVGAGLRRPWYEPLRRVFDAADVLLPNSRGEERALRRELRVGTPASIVPNGADERRFRLPDEPVERDCVVYVGRLEPHKNQLGLVRALHGTGLRLVLVGAEHPHHPSYAAACRAAARGQPVEFVPGLPQEQLAAIYQRARVHAMPSFFETTGLASLEAALSGAAVVTTREGWAAEYFDGLATYCRPSSRRSIRDAVLGAWEAGPPDGLRERILERYTWRHAAAATARAYELAA